MVGGFEHARYFIDRGGFIEERQASGMPSLIPFPVCLAIKYGDNIRAECPDFVLNIDESWVFIKSDDPPPLGTAVTLHFYVPPEDMLLAEIRGKVTQVNDAGKDIPPGMLILFSFFSEGRKHDLGEYLKRRKPLMDRRV